MALTADLVSTPLPFGHSPTGTLAESSTAAALLYEPSERNDEGNFETPSPCASKLARRVQKGGRQSQRAIPYNRITKDFARMNRSPKFAELIQRACGETSPREAAKGAVRGADGPIASIEPSNEDNERPGEETDYQQETKERSRTSPEEPTPDDAYSSKSTESPPPPPPPPRFTPKRHTIQKIFQDMRKVMRNSYKEEPGHAYILYDNLNRSPLFKLGSSTDIHHRVKEHQHKCQRPSWRSIQRPARNIPAPARLERLAQRELQNFQCDPQCSCGTEHTEYFWGSKEAGVEVLDFWSGWLQGKDKELEPYDCNGHLKNFWSDRLDRFQASIYEYFRCDNPQCAEKEEDAPACQACLRAGWRKWAEPTPADELDYACRMNIPSRSVQRGIQSVNGLNIIQTSFLIALVNLFGQVLSVWQWISDPGVILCAIPLRLLSGWVEPRIRLPDLASCWLPCIVDVMLIVVCVYTRLQRDSATGFGLLVSKSSPSPSPGYKKARGRKRTSLSGGEALEREAEDETLAVEDTEPGNGSTTKRASARRRST
ncbi:hypothetical protein BDW71DRAFT_173295 [Aspergillus fruticulosus]